MAVALIAGCSLGKAVPQTTMYVIASPAAAALPPVRRIAETLRVGNVRVAGPFAGDALVYRFSDVRYSSDPYHAFVSDPGEMLGGRVAEWLDRAGGFRAVAQPGSARPAAYVLEIMVAELYGDFRAGRAPAAVLAMQFALIDQAGPRPALRYEGSISRSIDLPQAAPEDLVRGYGKALAEILAQLSAELSAQL